MWYLKLKDSTTFPTVESRIASNCIKIIDDDDIKLLQYKKLMTDSNLSNVEILDENKNHVTFIKNLHFINKFTQSTDGIYNVGEYYVITMDEKDVKIRDLTNKLQLLSNAFNEFSLKSDIVIEDVDMSISVEITDDENSEENEEDEAKSMEYEYNMTDEEIENELNEEYNSDIDVIYKGGDENE